MRQPGILFCLLVCESVVAFLVCVGLAAAHEHDDSVVVQVTDKGFEPESVEVGSGDTVVFENVDQKAHWPASDDHLMHTRYPEFDPRKPLEPNAEWSFAFDKPGEWKYHDHQNPHLRGEIVVQADEEPGASDYGGRAGTGPGASGFFASIKTFFSGAYRASASALCWRKKNLLRTKKTKQRKMPGNYRKNGAKRKKTATLPWLGTKTPKSS